MSLMDTVSKPADRPVLVTICGDAGMGKTSLAAAFPKPIFIRSEDGMQSIPESQRPSAFPVIANAKTLWEQLTAVIHEPHDFQTLVIDSVTALERMFIADVMEQDPKAKSINQALGGYGAGTAAVAAMHQRVRKAAGLANAKRGMHVVFVAHADVETMKLPDVDDYMRYSLRLPAKSQPPYVDDVDVVGFVRLEMFTKGDDGDRKRAISTGDRELIVHATASNVSKNRYGLTDPLPFKAGENPLAAVIPALRQNAAKQPANQTNEGDE
jgi:AAA domain